MKTRNLTSKIFPVFTLVFSIILIPCYTVAQSTVVQGVVTDEEGTPLEKASLTFKDPNRGLSFHLKTDKNGKFIKVGIPPSVYLITVELEGYFLLQSQVRIQLGVKENLQITLKKIPPRLDEDKDLEEGVNFFNDGRYDEAIESFKRVIEKFPDNYEGYNNLGLSYLKNNNLDQAVDTLEKAIGLKPDSPSVYFALGESYFAKGESEKAIRSFSEAIELDPDNPMAFYNLGIIYYRQDENEEAIRAFDRAIELNQELSSAYYQAGLASVKMGDFERAIKYFEEFLKVEPDAPEAAQVKTIIEELKKN